ncbi:MAG: IS200/IS605 family element transposase accessory protein TnpB [Candidatus Omnitrophica bacterium]|nr:IS200/IS605 family element transposase accessory protein TnpB [Candidatus Omnitrophota bacterium]
MRKTYLYKAVINKQTEANCNKWLELCRNLYNQSLEQKIKAYKEREETISVYKQMSQLPDLRKSSIEFKTVGSQVLQDVLQRLDKAYKSFFQRVKQRNGRAGFPRFKSRNRYDSFTLKQSGWKLDGRYLYIKNIGRFKLFLSRPIEGNIKTITIRRSPANKWFVSFSCDDVPITEIPESIKEIGIDVGLKHFLVDSQGNSIENPKYFRQSEKLLRRRQRSLCRKKKGSNRRNEARVLVAKAHEKISNQRKDFLHKTANAYIDKFQTIYIEDLNIKGMVKNRYLSKSISDSSWGMFFRFLNEKAEGATRQIIKVPPHNTSQICSGCGEKVQKSLPVRIHNCPFCNTILERDHNASLNILRLGQSRQALTDRFLTTVA